MEDETDIETPVPGQLFLAGRMQGDILHLNLTLSRVVQTPEQVEQCRFSGPGWANKGYELTPFDLNVYISQRVDICAAEMVLAADVNELNYCAHLLE